MEFPDLGKHCTVDSCKQLDFLPVKCDACQRIFCKDHFSYTNHNCTESYKKDVQVPVCPLCNIPIAIKRGEPPDIKVGYHIDNECSSDPAVKRRKATKNRCVAVGCKKKELVPIICSRCKKQFCIKHRLEEDHDCKGFEGTGRGISNAGSAALNRLQSNAQASGPSNATRMSSRPAQTRQSALSAVGRDLDRERRERQAVASTQIQGHLSEEEAMAQAIAASLQQTPAAQSSSASPPVSTTQEEEDLALARALQQSEEEARRSRPAQQRQNSGRDSKCHVS